MKLASSIHVYYHILVYSSINNSINKKKLVNNDSKL